MEYEKPPLGVMPKHMHDELRAIELSRAIHDYIAAGMINEECIELWVDELACVVISRKKKGK